MEELTLSALWPQLLQIFGAAGVIIAFETAAIVALWRALQSRQTHYDQVLERAVKAIENNTAALNSVVDRLDLEDRLRDILTTSEGKK